ncbi:MAG: radical SAM protein [Acidimicrobiia bacterium]
MSDRGGATKRPIMKVLLVSTYDLGYQPLAVAGPAGILRDRGHDVRAVDLAVEPWDPALDTWADRIAISTPMHTATRIAHELAAHLTRPLACYGLYAEMCDDIAAVVGGRDPLTGLVRWIEDDPTTIVDLSAGAPARDLLPSLDAYTRLEVSGELRLVGSVEASSGCAHRCRHCPVPVVHNGRIRIVDVDAVLTDVQQQVDQGARHVSFVDPDFFNGVHHARRVARALHHDFPALTFDCTVKVEHVLRHEAAWSEMASAGCLFVVSAFESVNDALLERLDKHHTAADAARAVGVLRSHGIEVRPSWMPFTPWTSLTDVQDILEFVAEHDLVGSVDPVQYTIRLLLPRGSLLLDQLPILAWDAERLSYHWESALDALQQSLATLVDAAGDEPVATTYNRIREAVDLPAVTITADEGQPRLTESWFCCAEPTSTQIGRLGFATPASPVPSSRSR